jgi:hypothetical protein
VPRSREGVRAYFEAMRPKLAGSEAAQSMMAHLLDAEVMLPPLPRAVRPVSWAIARTLRAATIATMPRWMRRMGGLRQSRAVDALVTPVMRLSFRAVGAHPRLMLAILRFLSPGTVPIAAPVLLGVPAREPVTVTPTQARERAGLLPPAESYARFRARVDALSAARRSAGGQRPADLVGPDLPESVALLGRV